MRLPFPLLASCLATIRITHALPHADWASVNNGHQERDWSGVDKKTPEKYFHESVFNPHYDGRFASNELNYHERRAHLVPLIQTYLSTMNDIGAETWIMHGTLLGWYWNRKIMPWDSDADVMVSHKSMEHLAGYYNMTIHHYKLPGVPGGRDYMLEINPHWENDSTTDKHNVIDGRWVDMSSGLFIDITTLRKNLTARAEGVAGAMFCKDKHHYLYDDIFPLRPSTFEGVPVKVPYAYAELLEEEYHEQALSQTTFSNHKFDPEKQEWIPMNKLATTQPQLVNFRKLLPKKPSLPSLPSLPNPPSPPIPSDQGMRNLAYSPRRPPQ